MRDPFRGKDGRSEDFGRCGNESCRIGYPNTIPVTGLSYTQGAYPGVDAALSVMREIVVYRCGSSCVCAVIF